AHAHEEVHALAPAAERHGPVEAEAAEAEAEAGIRGEVILAGAAAPMGSRLVPRAARVEEDHPGGRRAEVDAGDAAAEVVRQRQADLVLELDERHAVAAVERIDLRLDEDVLLDDAEPVAARAAVELERPVARQRALAAERVLALRREWPAVERARDERADGQPRAGPGARVAAHVEQRGVEAVVGGAAVEDRLAGGRVDGDAAHQRAADAALELRGDVPAGRGLERLVARVVRQLR